MLFKFASRGNSSFLEIWVKDGHLCVGTQIMSNIVAIECLLVVICIWWAQQHSARHQPRASVHLL